MSNTETPRIAAHQASLSFTISQSLLRFMFIELVMLSNHLILLLPSPPALNLSQHQVLFQWVGFLHQVAKVLELQHQFFQWIFRVDFLLELTGLVLQSKGLSRIFSSSKSSILLCSALFMVHLSHPYMTTGKTIALSAKWCLCFLIHCLGLSKLFFQGASIF